MDTNDNKEFELVSDETIEEESVQEETAAESAVEESAPEAVKSEEPVVEESVTEKPMSENGTYHGIGAGVKESPYANSPYYTSAEARQNGYIPNNHYTRPEPKSQAQEHASAEPGQPKVKKKHNGAKRAVAAVLAAVLVAGSCGVTAWTVNEHWEEKFEEMEESFEKELEDIQKQIAKMGTSGSVSGGTSVSNTSGMTPSQVYARNVGAVVAITSTIYSTSNNKWGQTTTSVATGSGFVITEDGYVMTNYHVVEGGSELTVTLYTGEEYEAVLKGYDELNDVALLKVDATGMNCVDIGSSDELLVGDMVVAIGNPLGELTATMTVGYVSGKDRSVSTDGSIINMLQTDAAINSGNSGGPLFNMNGEVVGITTAKYSGESSSGASIEGIGFAIPIDDVMSMVEDLMNYGYVKNQAYLAVSVISMDSTTAAMYNMRTGSYVQSVVEGGSAYRAGVQIGDIIIAVGEYEVDSKSTLQTALRKFSAGDTTTITVYRAGEEVVLDITFDERPQDVDQESTEATEDGEMPESGSYQEWYDYFFGQGKNNGQP